MSGLTSKFLYLTLLLFLLPLSCRSTRLSRLSFGSSSVNYRVRVINGDYIDDPSQKGILLKSENEILELSYSFYELGVGMIERSQYIRLPKLSKGKDYLLNVTRNDLAEKKLQILLYEKRAGKPLEEPLSEWSLNW